MRNKLPEHLGRIGNNNYCNIDEGLLDYLIKTFDFKTMIDIGCANGDMVMLARSKNIDAYGIDGDYEALQKFSNSNVRDFLMEHDYTTGSANISFNPDLILSIEFLEHVEEQFLSNILENFTANILVICTPPPNSPGYHHVNCQTQEYWINRMLKCGYILSHKYTEEARKYSTMTDRGKPANYFKENGMIFTR